MSILRRTDTLAGAFRKLVAGAVLSLVPALVFGAYEFDFPKPVTPIAQEILDLHHLIIWICLVIFVLVFGVMFYSIFAHRQSRGHKAAKFHESTTVEVVWTAIPFLILVAMAVPSTATLIKMEDTRDAEVVVKITGYQWKWKYEYPDHDISFFSNLSTPRDQIENKAPKGEHYLIEVDNPLVIPVGKKVRFLVTANDVLHAWWVPKLGIKKDAIPGFINEMWARVDQPGTFRGQCAELCGKDHGFMPIVVNAVSEGDYARWVAEQRQMTAAAAASAGKTWSRNELMEKGKKVYGSTCAACHGPNGEGVGPFPKISGSKVATGPLAGHLNIVLKGKAGTAMQAFGAQLNDADIAAVVTYQRNALGNNAGDVVQPAQAKAAR